MMENVGPADYFGAVWQNRFNRQFVLFSYFTCIVVQVKQGFFADVNRGDGKAVSQKRNRQTTVAGTKIDQSAGCRICADQSDYFVYFILDMRWRIKQFIFQILIPGIVKMSFLRGFHFSG